MLPFCGGLLVLDESNPTYNVPPRTLHDPLCARVSNFNKHGLNISASMVPK